MARYLVPMLTLQLGLVASSVSVVSGVGEDVGGCSTTRLRSVPGNHLKFLMRPHLLGRQECSLGLRFFCLFPVPRATSAPHTVSKYALALAMWFKILPSGT